MFYGLSLFVTATLLAALWRLIANHRELIKPEISDSEIEVYLQTITPSLGFYIALILPAIFVPHVAAYGYLVIAIAMILLRARGDLGLKATEGAAE